MQNAVPTAEIPAHDLAEFDTVEEFVARYPDKFSENQIRWALRFRYQNGLDAAVVKFGRRMYIHRPTFLRIFASRAGAA